MDESMKCLPRFHIPSKSDTKSCSSCMCLQESNCHPQDIVMDRFLIQPGGNTVLQMLEDETHLMRLCRKLEWNEVERVLQVMLQSLKHHSDQPQCSRITTRSKEIQKKRKSTSSKAERIRQDIVDKIRRQLIAKDSNGNNILHLICYLKPPSSRILPLLFQVAQAADGLPLSMSRNDQASTALVVACSSRIGRSLINVLLQHGDSSLETILACDRKGNTPFTGLINGYQLLSKIPSLQNRYTELGMLDPSCLATDPQEQQLESSKSPMNIWNQWEEERRGCFPMLWDSCTELMAAAWKNSFPDTTCPSLLFGAALLAPALPPILTDVMFRFGETVIDSQTIVELIRLTIMSTKTAMRNATFPLQYSTYDSQALHFLQKLLHLKPQGMIERQEDVFSELFTTAIKAGLTWNSFAILDNVVDDWDDGESSSSSSSSLSADNREPLSKSRVSVIQDMKESLETHDRENIGWLPKLLAICPDAVRQRDQATGLYPFQLAAILADKDVDCKDWIHPEESSSSIADRRQVDTIYNILLSCPDVILGI